MGNKNINRTFGIVLATLLLFQLSYHTFHVFISHSSKTHMEQTGYHAQIDKTNTSCDLCAKLLGQSFFLWSNTQAIIGIILFTIISIGKTTNISQTASLVLTMRGPPSIPF